MNRNNKFNEDILRGHSIRCLPPEANQVITMLLNEISSLNHKICSKKSKRTIISSAQCANRQIDKLLVCLEEFKDHLQGLYSINPDEKIPIVCW